MKVNANIFFNPFSSAAQAVGNAGAAMNASDQMHNMPAGSGGGGVGVMDLVASIHFLWPLVMVWAELPYQIPHMPHG